MSGQTTEKMLFAFIACNQHDSLNKTEKSISRKSIFTVRFENLRSALLNKQYEMEEEEQVAAVIPHTPIQSFIGMPGLAWQCETP